MLIANDIKKAGEKFENSHIYRFGDFEMDLTEEILCHDGAKVAVNRRTFQVLKLLVERSGEIISKQDFFDVVWADTFVSDNSLTVAMTTLRKVLGDDAKNAKFIENLPRKGYRFIAEVEIVNNEPQVECAKIEQAVETDATTEKDANEKPVTNVHPSPTNHERRLPRNNRAILFGIGGVSLLVLLFVVGFGYLNTNSQKDSPRIKSIAVLPFQNQNADTEFLSDGLTETVINDLAELPSLRVISRNSAFEYKGRTTDLAEIKRALNVEAALTGRFVERGDDFIINAELIDLRNNQQLWGRQYTRPKNDGLILQKDIASDVTESLRSKLADETRQRLARRGTDDEEAFRLYLKGVYYWNKRTQKNLDEAVDFFNQAIEKDPTYAQAYTGLASAYILRTSDGMNIEERYQLVQATARKALEIDENSGEAYAVLGVSNCFFKWDFATAEKQYRRAIEINPNYATAHHWLAELLAIENKFDESFAEYNRAIELDPLSLAIQTDVAMNYFYARQNDKAIEYLKNLKAVNPNYARIESALVGVYEEKKMFPEAIEAWKHYCVLVGESSSQIADKITPMENDFKASGAEGYWRNKLKIEANRLIGGDFGYAIVYARLGENDKAFEYLEKTFAEHNGASPYLKLRPEFDNLHSDGRFINLTKRVGLP